MTDSTLGYRDAAGRASEEPLPPVKWIIRSEKKKVQVHPHEFGRWACPACGAWRWVAWLTARAEHAVGKVVVLTRLKKRDATEAEVEDPVGHGEKWYPRDLVLRRECPRCEYAWHVDALPGAL